MTTPYTTIPEQQKILYQCFVAFGFGSGGLRVPRGTCATMHRYFARFLHDEKGQPREDRVGTWGQESQGPQVLERVRAMGRLAALKAVTAGSTTITSDHFEAASYELEKANSELRIEEQTEWCPSSPTGGSPTDP